jgi:PAS domain S-box-containing protein
MSGDLREPVILVIDDDPDNLAIVADYFSDYTVLVAEDGDSGVARARYAKPDLILLDVMMPGIDGFETCRRLKSLEGTKDIPVIFMTALSETEHKVKGFDAGGVDYITKPFQREEMLARVGVHARIRELTSRLQLANESLEKRVAERTSELAKTVDALHAEIIERKRAEEARVRLARAIEQAAEAVFMADAGWVITYVNPAFERLTGFSRDEAVGEHTRILRSGVHDVAFHRMVRDAIRRDHVWSGRITTRRKDGSLFEAETTVSSVLDPKGEIVDYVSIVRDVTPELKAEHDLRQSQKMEAIGTLAGGIAHDFNNILTAIMGYTDMAIDKIQGNEAAAYDLQRVQEASLRAKELVNRILIFSRQGEQERKRVQVASIVEEVLRLLRSTLPSTIEIRQHVSADGKACLVDADPTQIHQVLMNLGTNAAHAMRDHGGILEIYLAEIDVDATLAAHLTGIEPGHYIRLTVSDTGHGMSANVRERIFDPYFTTKKVGEGTGMGLAVVQGIVRGHGGAISVYSEPGRGTTFHVYLPRFEGGIATPAAAPEAFIGGMERILFVDDEAVLAELGKKLLESLGYAVSATSSSREALEIFRADPKRFDLVITDMTMPGLSGKELAAELLAARPGIPIILCTGFSEHINEGEAAEAGIRKYVMKPYSAKALSRIIRDVLEGEAT